MTNDIKTSIAGLVKIAEQMVDAVETPKSVSPDEAYDALEGIISQLEALAQSIPTEGGAGGSPAEPESPAISGTPKEDPRVASLEKTVKTLKAQLDDAERIRIAEEFKSYFSDPKVAEEKANEILNSKESLDVLQAKLNTIAEYAEVNDVPTTRTARSSNLSGYVRVAQRTGNERMHTL